ncbi:hypothetical protein L1987_23142 [Smallanthus sonchifolius]|uniref:Uncharacterized protein n=1 Tax=Smallanthus sonchifolius TaxID=185202 RepID=A0ACB9IGM5_9ASTR|nr:hypothetical protein L1987_23142 [Smallanthus sonchifolius]
MVVCDERPDLLGGSFLVQIVFYLNHERISNWSRSEAWKFAVNEDLSTYPSDFLGDIEEVKSIPNDVDVIFSQKNMHDYGVEREQLKEKEKEGGIVSCLEDEGGRGIGHETWIRVEKLEKGMCGKSRHVFFT